MAASTHWTFAPSFHVRCTFSVSQATSHEPISLFITPESMLEKPETKLPDSYFSVNSSGFTESTLKTESDSHSQSLRQSILNDGVMALILLRCPPPPPWSPVALHLFLFLTNKKAAFSEWSVGRWCLVVMVSVWAVLSSTNCNVLWPLFLFFFTPITRAQITATFYHSFW